MDFCYRLAPANAIIVRVEISIINPLLQCFKSAIKVHSKMKLGTRKEKKKKDFLEVKKDLPWLF